MRSLKFSVKGQSLNKNGDFSSIIRGSKGYLCCDFSFEGSDWTGSKVVAVFEHNKQEYAVAVKPNGTCMVPDEVTDESYFRIRLVGVRDDTRIVTNRVLVSQEG